ncbi:hypothetical protein A3H11_02850 [Candidatus Uhrbacteria bacterium RIFCSPLOWO2_12_FULL_47_10]|nr:MAG: hypothetical protein A3J03_02595 [Candidatus Uhrbacteria bacterium RIFCSPLOWO2_02_FULL_46_25]OGL92553.1 MAG: hypothetical protein A3H11_02850 [Candidatus Uhrbacteria bacterium RIFCSPLOWO2_12_FULL_47_10]
MSTIPQKQHRTKDKNTQPDSAMPNNSQVLAKEEMQPETIDRIRNILMKDVLPEQEFNGLIKEYVDLADTSKELKPKQKERKSELLYKLSFHHGLKNGMWVKNLSYAKYSEALRKMRHDIVLEYSCKTSLELMLADRIVASYWRAMKYDAHMNRLIEKEDGGFSFDQLKVNVLKELNRGLEFANRQLHTNMILLKQLKQPPINIKVNAENAFIAKNQQINASNEAEPKNYEIIESK